MPQPPKRLVIIDGNHLIHRAFYAITTKLTTSRGEPTNALFGFASILFNILEAEHPDCLVVTFDEKAPTFRHDAHEGYKATRIKAPDELYVQIPFIRRMVERGRIPMFFQGGFEADDFMGTLAAKAAALGFKSFIVTGDMDALQLIDPDTLVVFPHKGYREPLVYDRDKVFEKYGVYPEQIVDYKAMMGDSSDNIKGVQGIGPKGASTLLRQYGTLDNIYAHLNEIPLLTRNKLSSGKDDAYFAKELATIVRDVPCDFDPEKAALKAFDFNGLADFFTEMEMHSLQRRLKKIIPRDLSAAQGQMSLF